MEDLNNIVRIGDNDHGYSFVVGEVDGRWLGCAIGSGMIFILPGMSEEHRLGLSDREQAIKLTGAVALDPTHGYGGITRWFVPEDLQGKPEDFACSECGSVGCEPDAHDVDYSEDPF